MHAVFSTINMADTSVFRTAILHSLKAWPVIKIAEAHGFGGGNVKDKIEWLGDSIHQIFTDNDVVYPDELEDYIAEALYNEFDTMVEDGSSAAFSEMMCQYYRWWSSGEHQKIADELNKLYSIPLNTVEFVQTGNCDDNDSDGEPTATPSMGNQNSMHIEDCRIDETQVKENGNAEEMETEEPSNSMNAGVDEQGWEVVRRTKGRKR